MVRSEATIQNVPQISSLATPPVDSARANLTPVDLAPEDFYFEGPYLVFTAVYHVKRGFCCNSDCRHCPFK